VEVNKEGIYKYLQFDVDTEFDKIYGKRDI
jgi:hypothetical protein